MIQRVASLVPLVHEQKPENAAGVGEEGVGCSPTSLSSLANAGTHNHREMFGEDSEFGTATNQTARSRGMGPCVRRDDSKYVGPPYPFG